MRSLILLFLVASAQAQGPRLENSNTTESLRGVSVVSRQVAWASGTHGTYLRTTDGGVTWTPAQIPDAATLDFRAVVAFSADESFLMSAGPGDQSRIYHTSDGGQHWLKQFVNSNPKGFFDSMVFWDTKHGLVLGDPVPDDAGHLKFELLATDDGETWHALPSAQLPSAVEGEGAFAASNSCIAILRAAAVDSDGTTKEKAPTSSRADQGLQSGVASAAEGSNIWFATGGKAARVFHSGDRGQTWTVVDTPLLHGPESAGIFSIAFRDAQNGVIAGGDYKHPRDDGPNLAFTSDGGKTWKLADIHPQAYFSAVGYDRKVIEDAKRQQAAQQASEKAGKKIRVKPVAPQRLFVIGQDFLFDFRPPLNPRGMGAGKKLSFNAVAAFPEGGALIVGAKGTIAFLP
jgi:photosystem II stability/assembly factor-like uncharacterized protein